MSPSPLEQFFLEKEEPLKSALLFLKDHLLSDEEMEIAWKWKLPYFVYRGKGFGYLWTDKKNGLPYLAFMKGKDLDHPALIQEGRKLVKVLHFHPDDDLPMETIDEVVRMAKALY